MKTFFSADQHFFHGPPYTRNSIAVFCKRPYASTDEMNENMIRRWNAVVGPEDTVYHLGDFGLSSVENLKSVFERLNGNKIAVLGNHDGSVARLRRIGFDRVEKSIVLEDRTMLVHDRLTLDGAQVLESSDPQIRVSFLAYPRVLCGHVHNMWKRNGNCYNVGVDVWNFRPVTMSQIMEVEHG